MLVDAGPRIDQLEYALIVALLAGPGRRSVAGFVSLTGRKETLGGVSRAYLYNVTMASKSARLANSTHSMPGVGGAPPWHAFLYGEISRVGTLSVASTAALHRL